MAEATSRDDCLDRHREYSIDISSRVVRGLQLARLRRMLAPVRPGDRVLDVGCNSGYIVDFLPPRCVAYGVDVAHELVEKARHRLRDAKLAPAEELPFEDDSFDVVVLGEILEHVYDPAEVLLEAVRVSRRLVVGSTPHEAGDWGPRGPRAPATHRHHVRCYTAETLTQDLERAGLHSIELSAVERGRVPQIHVFAATVPEPRG